MWLSGSGAGRDDVLVDNLPGVPDNLSTGTDGRIWVALPAPRNPLLDWLHTKPSPLRRAAWALPGPLQPKPERTAWVMAVDAQGDVVCDLQGAGERYHMVTGMREHGGRLYLGSLTEWAVAWFELPGQG